MDRWDKEELYSVLELLQENINNLKDDIDYYFNEDNNKGTIFSTTEYIEHNVSRIHDFFMEE